MQCNEVWCRSYGVNWNPWFWNQPAVELWKALPKTNSSVLNAGAVCNFIYNLFSGLYWMMFNIGSTESAKASFTHLPDNDCRQFQLIVIAHDRLQLNDDTTLQILHKGNWAFGDKNAKEIGELYEWYHYVSYRWLSEEEKNFICRELLWGYLHTLQMHHAYEKIPQLKG